jgi:hypothetical protein
MRVEHDVSPVVRAWLKGTRRSPYGAQQTVSSVMQRVPDVPQRRRRRWSTPSFRLSSPTPVRSSGRPASIGGSGTFSALRLVAAAGIVALFGGLLIGGVLTRPRGDEMAPAAVTGSPSPMTTQELLAGMVTEEVAPGVLHLLKDGVRDLAQLPYADWGVAVKVDGAGMVWRLVDGRYFRIGAEGASPRTGRSGSWPPSDKAEAATPRGPTSSPLRPWWRSSKEDPHAHCRACSRPRSRPCCPRPATTWS